MRTKVITKLSSVTTTRATDLQSINKLGMSNNQIKHNWGDHMAQIKMKADTNLKFQNVGLIKEDHEKLRKLAAKEQRSMARQLSVLIQKAVAEMDQSR